MFKSILLVSALAASAFAQASGSSASASAITATAVQVMPAIATAGFNPGNVTRTTALSWCRAQINTCTDICTGRWSANVCNENSFTYSCTCSNGTIPDCTAFQQTLPYYICQETYIQCINLHPSTDPEGQQTCISDRKCGTRNATAERAALSSSTTSAASSSSASAASTAASSSSSRAAADYAVTPVSTGAFAALLFALCRLVL